MNLRYPTRARIAADYDAARARRGDATLPVPLMTADGTGEMLMVDAAQPGVLNIPGNQWWALEAYLIRAYPRDMVLTCNISKRQNRNGGFIRWDGPGGDPRRMAAELVGLLARRRDLLRAAGYVRIHDYLRAGGTDLPWRVVAWDNREHDGVPDATLNSLLMYGPDAGIVPVVYAPDRTRRVPETDHRFDGWRVDEFDYRDMDPARSATDKVARGAGMAAREAVLAAGGVSDIEMGRYGGGSVLRRRGFPPVIAQRTSDLDFYMRQVDRDLARFPEMRVPEGQTYG